MLEDLLGFYAVIPQCDAVFFLNSAAMPGDF
jgi:hypothetical protein